MNAPLKVLLFSTFIVVTLVVVVLYRFNLLQFKPASVTPVRNEVPETPLPEVKHTVDLVNGKKLYEVKTCILCHGVDGKANTPMGKAVGATDLTQENLSKNTKNLPRMDYVYQVIEQGISGTAMVSFKAQIPSETDKLDLAAYVVSLKD